MSGADLLPDEIANGVFSVLHPECPAFPGIPNACDTSVCDCFNCDQLPAKVAAIIAWGERLALVLRRLNRHARDDAASYALHGWDDIAQATWAAPCPPRAA